MTQTTFKTRSRSPWRLVLIGILAAGLGSLALAPTAGPVEGDPGTTNGDDVCVGREIEASYSTANTWQYQIVCSAVEVAIASGGECPAGSAMRGAVVTTPGPLDRKAWLKCTGTGTALWTATCCPFPGPS